MVPTVISSSFRRSGIYPFNPDVLDYGEVTNSAISKQINHQLVHHKQTESQTVHGIVAEDKIFQPTFTPSFFPHRFAENYEIFDFKLTIHRSISSIKTQTTSRMTLFSKW